MRWLFLLLMVLNIFYAVWHQQEVPTRPKELAPLSLYKGEKRDIQLLSESGAASDRAKCLLLGGFSARAQAESLRMRLSQLGVEARLVIDQGSYWVRIEPSSRPRLNDSGLESLSNEFNDLKHKIMQCEGIATVE